MVSLNLDLVPSQQLTRRGRSRRRGGRRRRRTRSGSDNHTVGDLPLRRLRLLLGSLATAHTAVVDQQGEVGDQMTSPLTDKVGHTLQLLAQRYLVLVGHDAIDTGLEVREQWKPDTRTMTITLVEGAIVGQRVVVEEEAGGDVEGDEDIDRVVLVPGQDEEGAEEIQHPADRVHVVHRRRCVCGWGR